MTQLYASVALATASTLAGLALLLLRFSVHGHRPALTLVRRWSVSSNRTSLAILAPLGIIAVWSFATIPALHLPTYSNPSPAGGVASAPLHTAEGRAVNALRDYIEKIDSDTHSGTTSEPASVDVELPAVDVMVAKLITRLQEQPNDVGGWKMLGWSYLNTNRPAEAVEAYQAALKLEPGNAEIEKVLKAAQSVQLASLDATDAKKTVEATSAEPSLEQDNMVRGMVERLASRLETSPDDEDGWIQLMRSRMVLNEKEAASAALSKALSSFADNSAAQERLTAAAQSLGIERPKKN